MGYKRFTAEERRLIHQLLKAERSRGEIGRLLGRSKGALSREIKRNTGQCGYRPKQAQERAEARARRPGARKFTAEMHVEVERKIRKGDTPEIIKGRAAHEGRAMVCKDDDLQFHLCGCQNGRRPVEIPAAV